MTRIAARRAVDLWWFSFGKWIKSNVISNQNQKYFIAFKTNRNGNCRRHIIANLIPKSCDRRHSSSFHLSHTLTGLLVCLRESKQRTMGRARSTEIQGLFNTLPMTALALCWWSSRMRDALETAAVWCRMAVRWE